MRESRPISGRMPRSVLGRAMGLQPKYSPSALGPVNSASGSPAIGDEVLTELLTIAAAATTDTSIQIPANSWVNQVEAKVEVAIPTAATFDYGISGATTRYGTGISVNLNTYSAGTIDGRRYYAAATAIRFTPNLTPGTNVGRVRVTIHYNKGTP